jgi:hypothetical protein
MMKDVKMMKGQDIYDERKRLQNENSLLLEERNNRRLKNEKELEEGMMIIVSGIRALLEGKAVIKSSSFAGITTHVFERVKE